MGLTAKEYAYHKEVERKLRLLEITIEEHEKLLLVKMTKIAKLREGIESLLEYNLPVNMEDVIKHLLLKDIQKGEINHEN